MKVSHNWLQTYFKQKLPKAEELVSLFTFHAFEIEGLEEFKDKDGKIIDYVIDAKVLPDRSHYALSHKGIAREISVISGIELKPNRIPNGPKPSSDDKPSIIIENKNFCRRYMGRMVDLKNTTSSAGVCTMLEAIGQKTINGVVDAANMVMFDCGQPLHVFDADKVVGGIVVRSAKNGEKIVLLDGQEVALGASDNVIADDMGPLAIAGVKGGKRAEVTIDTKRIIIESANFEPTAVRKTSTRLNLRNESSKRYENDITPGLAFEAIDNISALIAEISPNAKFGPIVDVYPVKAKQNIIKFDPAYIAERLGTTIPLDKAKITLEKMGVSVTDEDSMWHLIIPFDRLDLCIKEDIVEEVGRIHGYDHIKGILPPKTEVKFKVLPEYYIIEKIKNILVSCGFSEVSLYSLVAKGDIETAKPLAKDKAFVRNNLSDGMLQAVERNSLNAELLGLDSIRLFEIGRVFSMNGEKISLSIGASQIKKVKGLNGEKLLIDAIGNIQKNLGIDIGKLKPSVKGNYYVIETDLSDIIKKVNLDNASYKDLGFGSSSANKFKKYSQYPFIVRDIALFVSESISAEMVWSEIDKGLQNASANSLLARKDLFDVFKKDGKTSYAYRLVFQSFEKTLTDDEVNKIMDSIYSVAKEKGYEVR